MKSIEDAIYKGVKEAQKRYVGMNNWWLHHAPESFLTTIVGLKIGESLNRYVYFDKSLSVIARELQDGPKYRRPRGRPPKIPTIRPDLSIWAKTTWSIIAAIEVKRTNGNTLIDKDVEKLRAIIGTPVGPKAAYVLGYTDAKKRSTLDARFKRWGNQKGLKLCKPVIGKTDEDGNT